MTDLSQFAALRADLARKVGREKDPLLRSHLSNLGEVIDNYLKPDDEAHRDLIGRVFLPAAVERLKDYRARRLGEVGR